MVAAARRRVLVERRTRRSVSHHLGVAHGHGTDHQRTISRTSRRGATLACARGAMPVARTWGDCYGYLLVATGRAEIMVDDIVNPWDAAALQPIIEEAGGVFTSWRNKRSAFDGDVIATNAALATWCANCWRSRRRSHHRLREYFMTPAPQTSPASNLDLDLLDFSKANGFVTVVAQDATTGVVLMVAHADREALERTLATGEMHYTSRTRGLWHKGATSGNVQRVVSLSADCDGDAVLARVAPAGPACHTGMISCFGNVALGASALGVLAQTIAARAGAMHAASG